MKRFSRAALLPSALAGILTALPALAALPPEQETSPRLVAAGVKLAQMGDVDVFIDEQGRRILLDSRTGVVIGVEPSRRGFRTRIENPSARPKEKRPEQQKAGASGRTRTKRPAQAVARAPDQPKAKAPAPKKRPPAERRPPKPAATIDGPEYFDFQPEPLSPVAFAGLMSLAPPQPKDALGAEASTEPAMGSGQKKLPEMSPPLTASIREPEVGRPATPAPPTQASGADGKKVVDSEAEQHAGTGREEITGSVQIAAPVFDGSKSASRHGQESGSAVRAAAERGDLKAQMALGAMYRSGDGASADDVEAAKWFRRAAEQGEPEAQFNLGRMYQSGDGVLQDYVFAHMWFNLSAAQGYDKAKEARSALADTMTEEQVAEAQQLAREWKPSKAARPQGISPKSAQRFSEKADAE